MRTEWENLDRLPQRAFVEGNDGLDRHEAVLSLELPQPDPTQPSPAQLSPTRPLAPHASVWGPRDG